MDFMDVFKAMTEVENWDFCPCRYPRPGKKLPHLSPTRPKLSLSSTSKISSPFHQFSSLIQKFHKFDRRVMGPVQNF